MTPTLPPEIVEELAPETAPRDGKPVLLRIGETIPDQPDWRVGTYLSGDDAEEMGYPEYAKYGGWLIWNTECDWFVIDVCEALAWFPLPAAIKLGRSLERSE